MYTGEESGRHYTVSIALPGSIVDNAQTHELKTYLGGQVRGYDVSSVYTSQGYMYTVSPLNVTIFFLFLSTLPSSLLLSPDSQNSCCVLHR